MIMMKEKGKKKNERSERGKEENFKKMTVKKKK